MRGFIVTSAPPGQCGEHTRTFTGGSNRPGEAQPNLRHFGATILTTRVSISDIVTETVGIPLTGGHRWRRISPHTTPMRSSPRLFPVCLAVFALAAWCRVPPRRAGMHATHHLRHAAPGTVHRLTGRHFPAGTEVDEVSVDNDDDTADDDAGSSLDVGVPADQAWRVVLADTFLLPQPPRFSSLLARGHVHATRAPPRCPLTATLTASAND
jgi:hypothetical protein